MTSILIILWQIDREKVETVADFMFLGFKITTNSDYSHEIKRYLLLGRNAMANLLLLLSHFSHVRLCATPSLGFSRQEHWSGLPFPFQCINVKSESEVAQPCPTLCDPIDCSLSGSSVHGIFQARVLEWGAIAFS